jgi:hypothetical protein
VKQDKILFRNWKGEVIATLYGRTNVNPKIGRKGKMSERKVDWRNREDWEELRKAYKTLGNAINFKVGDKVKILRKADDFELGWSTFWPSEKDKYIGKVGKIIKVVPSYGSIAVAVEGEVWLSPWFVLELVEPVSEKHTITIDGKSTEVSEEAYNEIKNLFE